MLLHVKAEADIPPHKHFLIELKFGLEGRLIWAEESVPAKKQARGI